ncbi:MAG: 4Fe-4S binding protein [Candidatus Tantalella remota]|nr:4Fe-4S binding protein [Candidatus Tantalella remota]
MSILILGPSKKRPLTSEQEETIMAVKIDNEKCTGCAACIDICPVNVIKIENGKAVVSEECLGCGVCISQCSVEAITFLEL